jgi:hypothetical protein
LNIRLSPVEVVGQSADEIRRDIVSRVEASGDPALTGVSCVNLDDRVTDGQVRAIFETVFDLRRRAGRGGGPGGVIIAGGREQNDGQI